jgi:hypothetical protein
MYDSRVLYGNTIYAYVYEHTEISVSPRFGWEACGRKKELVEVTMVCY